MLRDWGLTSVVCNDQCLLDGSSTLTLRSPSSPPRQTGALAVGPQTLAILPRRLRPTFAALTPVEAPV